MLSKFRYNVRNNGGYAVLVANAAGAAVFVPANKVVQVKRSVQSKLSK